MKSSDYSELFDAVGRVMAQHGMTDSFVGLVLDYCTFAGHSRLRYIFIQLGRGGILREAASATGYDSLARQVDAALADIPQGDRDDTAASIWAVGVASGIVTPDQLDEYFSARTVASAEEPEYVPVEIELSRPEPSSPYVAPPAPAPAARPKGKVPAANNKKKRKNTLISIITLLIVIGVVGGGIIVGYSQAHRSDEEPETANGKGGIVAVKSVTENVALVLERKKQGDKVGFRNLPFGEKWDKAMAAVDTNSNFLNDDFCKRFAIYNIEIKRTDSLMKTFADTKVQLFPHPNSDHQMKGKLRMDMVNINKDYYYCLLYEDEGRVGAMSLTSNPFQKGWMLDNPEGVYDEFHRLYGEPEVYHPGEYVWTYPEVKIVIDRTGAYFIPRMFSGLQMWSR